MAEEANKGKNKKEFDLVIIKATYVAGRDRGGYRKPGEIVEGVSKRDAEILMGDKGGRGGLQNKAAEVNSKQANEFLAELAEKEGKENPKDAKNKAAAEKAAADKLALTDKK